MLDQAFFSHRSENGNTIAHPGDEIWLDGFVHCDDIFLFVIVSSAEDLVDDVAIVGEEDEPLGGFVQSADGEEALLMPDKGDDILGLFRISGADDTHGFIEGDVQCLRFGFEGFTINADDIARMDTISCASGFVIDRHTAAIDQSVGFPTGADTGLADEFIEADGVVVGCFQTGGCSRSERLKSR